MTTNDQPQTIPAGLTRDQAQAVRDWAERSYAAEVQDETMYHAARVLLAVLPKRPTMADMTDDELAETALETYYRLECRTPVGTWVAYENNTTKQGWTTNMHYVETQLEDALDGCPEDADQYRIVTQLRGPITVYPKEAGQ